MYDEQAQGRQGRGGDETWEMPAVMPLTVADLDSIISVYERKTGGTPHYAGTAPGECAQMVNGRLGLAVGLLLGVAYDGAVIMATEGEGWPDWQRCALAVAAGLFGTMVTCRFWGLD